MLMNRPSNDANGFAYKHTDQLLLFHVLQFLQSVVENGARLANQDRREDFRQVGQRHAALGALGDPVINTKLSILLFFCGYDVGDADFEGCSGILSPTARASVSDTKYPFKGRSDFIKRKNGKDARDSLNGLRVSFTNARGCFFFHAKKTTATTGHSWMNEYSWTRTSL